MKYDMMFTIYMVYSTYVEKDCTRTI